VATNYSLPAANNGLPEPNDGLVPPNNGEAHHHPSIMTHFYIQKCVSASTEKGEIRATSTSGAEE